MRKTKMFQVNPQRQFIIVCGNINFDSVNGFLKDFFHPARDDTNTEVRRKSSHVQVEIFHL